MKAVMALGPVISRSPFRTSRDPLNTLTRSAYGYVGNNPSTTQTRAGLRRGIGLLSRSTRLCPTTSVVLPML